MYKKISSRVVGSDTTALTRAQTRPVLSTRLVLINWHSSVSLKHSHNIRSRGDDVLGGGGEERGGARSSILDVAQSSGGAACAQAPSTGHCLHPHFRMTGIMTILLVPSAQNTRTRRGFTFLGTQHDCLRPRRDFAPSKRLEYLFCAESSAQPPAHSRCVTCFRDRHPVAGSW